MAIRNNKLGGLDWDDEQLFDYDLNDTFDATINEANKVGVGIAQNAYQTLQANNIFENKDFLAADEFVTASGTNGTVNAVSSTANFSTDKYEISTITTYENDNQQTTRTGQKNTVVTNMTTPTRGIISKVEVFNVASFSNNYTVEIKDSSNNVLASKTLSVPSLTIKSFTFTESDYSRVLNNESFSVTTTATSASPMYLSNKSFSGSLFSYSNQDILGTYSSSYTVTPYEFKEIIFKTSDTVACNTNPVSLTGNQKYLSVYADKETPTNTDITLDVLQVGSATTKCISTEVSGINDLFFSSNGNSFYILSGTSEYQYNMTTPFDISTATYHGSFNFSPQNRFPRGLYLSTDGTKAYVGGYIDNTVYEYILSTPYDITTASLNTASDFSTYISGMFDITFSSDGTKMFLIVSGGRIIKSYTLSTAWSLATWSNDNKSFDIDNALGGKPQGSVGCIFNNNGTKLFATFSDSYTYEFTLSTAYDLSTATYNGKYKIFNRSGGSIYTKAVFGDSGNKLFIADNSNVLIVKYDLLNNYDISTACFYPIINSITNQPVNSTIDISSLGSGTLQLQFNLLTTDTSVTPKIYGWGVYLK